MQEINNNNSILQGKVRPEDLEAIQELNKLKKAAEDLARQYTLRRLECESEASSYVDNMLSQVQLRVEGDDGYFTGGIDGLLDKLYEFLKPLFSEFGVEIDPKVYEMLKEKKKKSWLVSIIKFINDKLKQLIKKIFVRDLSFDQKLDKEIKELQEKLDSGELSEEEFARTLERLTALRDLKLKLQMFAVGWVISMVAEIFGIELASVVEASKEEATKEDKKTEKTSLKEKEVREELKVDKREKPQLTLDVEGQPRKTTIPLFKPEEFDLLSKSIKESMLPVPKSDVRENSENSSKSKVKRTHEGEETPEVCPPAPKQTPVASRVKFDSKDAKEDVNFEGRDANTNVNGRGTTPLTDKQERSELNKKSANCAKSDLNGNINSINKERIKSTNRQGTDDLAAKLAEKVAQTNAQRKASATVNNAQPPSKCNNVKVNNHVDSIGRNDKTSGIN